MSSPSKLRTTARTSGTFVRKICSSSGIRSNSAVLPPSSFHGFSCSAGQISECESSCVYTEGPCSCSNIINMASGAVFPSSPASMARAAASCQI